MEISQLSSKMNSSSTYIEENNFNDIKHTTDIVGHFFEDLDLQWVSEKLLHSLTYDDNLQLGNQNGSKENEDTLMVNIPEISDTFLEAILNDQDMGFSLLDVLDTLEQDDLLYNKKGNHSPNNQDECFSPNNLKDERVPVIQQYSQHQTSSSKRFNVERVDLLSAEASVPSHKKKKAEISSLPTEEKQSSVDEVSICDKSLAQPEPMIRTTKSLLGVNAKQEARQLITYLPVSQPIVKRKTRYTSKLRNNTLRLIPSPVSTKRKTGIKLDNLPMLQPVVRRRTRSTCILSENALRLKHGNTTTKREINKTKLKVNKKRAAKLHIKSGDKKDRPQGSPHNREPYHQPHQELANLSMLQPVVKRRTRSTCNLRENALRLKPGNTTMKRKVNKNKGKVEVNKKRAAKLDIKFEDKEDRPQGISHNRELYHRPDQELVNLSLLQPVVKRRTRSTCNLRENALHLKPGNTTTKRKVKVSKKRAAKLHIKSEDKKDLPQDSPHNRAAVLNVKRSHSIETIFENEEENSASRDILRMTNSTQDRRNLHSTTKPKVKRIRSTEQNAIKDRKNNVRSSLLDSAHHKDLFEDKNSLSEDQSNKTAVPLDVQVKCSYSPEKGCFLSANPAEYPLTDTKDEKLSFRERNLIAARKYRQKKREYFLQVKQSLKEKLPPSELEQLENKVFEAKLKIRHRVSERREPNKTVRNNKKEQGTNSKAKLSVELIRKHKAAALASRRYRERQKMYTQQLQSKLNSLGISESPR